jgi:hypothetical protein
VANELGGYALGEAAPTDLAVIDLGGDFQPVETKAEIHVRNRRARRTGALVALVLVALLGISAAAGPSPDALTPAAQLDVDPGATVMVAGDTAYVVEVRRVRKELSAYRLSGGHRLWTAVLRTEATGAVLYRIGSTMLVSYTGAALGVQTDGVDMGSGRLLWQSAASVIDVSTGRLVMSTSGVAGVDQLSRVDPITGEPLWTTPIGQDCYSDLAETYAELCPATGLLRVVDLSTGAVRGERRLDLGGTPAGGPAQETRVALSQADGVIVAGHQTTATPVLDGFAAADLRPLWSEPFFPESTVADCGTVFCMYDSEIGTGVNPQTGASMGFPGYAAFRDRGLPIPDIWTGPVQLNTRHALIPAGSIPDQKRDYPSATALVAVPDSAPVRVPSSANVDTFLASVDQPTGRLTILDRLHDVGVQSCVALGAYLACEKPGSRLDFWRLSG